MIWKCLIVDIFVNNWGKVELVVKRRALPYITNEGGSIGTYFQWWELNINYSVRILSFQDDFILRRMFCLILFQCCWLVVVSQSCDVFLSSCSCLKRQLALFWILLGIWCLLMHVNEGEITKFSPFEGKLEILISNKKKPRQSWYYSV